MIAPRDDDIQARFFDPALTWRLLGYVRAYLGYAIFSLVVFLAMAVLLNALPVLVKYAIDTYLAAGSEALPPPERLDGILRIGLWYFALSAMGYTIRGKWEDDHGELSGLQAHGGETSLRIGFTFKQPKGQGLVDIIRTTPLRLPAGKMGFWFKGEKNPGSFVHLRFKDAGGELYQTVKKVTSCHPMGEHRE